MKELVLAVAIATFPSLALAQENQKDAPRPQCETIDISKLPADSPLKPTIDLFRAMGKQIECKKCPVEHRRAGDTSREPIILCGRICSGTGLGC